MDLSTLSSADIVSFIMAVTSLIVSAALFIYKIRN